MGTMTYLEICQAVAELKWKMLKYGLGDDDLELRLNPAHRGAVGDREKIEGVRVAWDQTIAL